MQTYRKTLEHIVGMSELLDKHGEEMYNLNTDLKGLMGKYMQQYIHMYLVSPYSEESRKTLDLASTTNETLV